MQLVYGPLTDLKGRRKILLTGISIYIFASLECAFSKEIYIFLLFRSIQAVGIAAGSVVVTTVIADLFDGKECGQAMGMFQMSVSLGPMGVYNFFRYMGMALGPMIGSFFYHIGGNVGLFGAVSLLFAGSVLFSHWQLIKR